MDPLLKELGQLRKLNDRLRMAAGDFVLEKSCHQDMINAFKRGTNREIRGIAEEATKRGQALRQVCRILGISRQGICEARRRETLMPNGRFYDRSDDSETTAMIREVMT